MLLNSSRYNKKVEELKLNVDYVSIRHFHGTFMNNGVLQYTIHKYFASPLKSTLSPPNLFTNRQRLLTIREEKAGVNNTLKKSLRGCLEVHFESDYGSL